MPCPTREIPERVEFKRFPCETTLRPKTFLITSGDEWENAETYKKDLLKGLRNVKKYNRESWLSAVFSLKHGMLRFERGSDFKFKWIKENPLLAFLLFLNEEIATIPPYIIDIQKYRTKIQEIEGLQ